MLVPPPESLRHRFVLVFPPPPLLVAQVLLLTAFSFPSYTLGVSSSPVCFEPHSTHLAAFLPEDSSPSRRFSGQTPPAVISFSTGDSDCFLISRMANFQGQGGPGKITWEMIGVEGMEMAQPWDPPGILSPTTIANSRKQRTPACFR